jgi:hypothetical protein
LQMRSVWKKKAKTKGGRENTEIVREEEKGEKGDSRYGLQRSEKNSGKEKLGFERGRENALVTVEIRRGGGGTVVGGKKTRRREVRWTERRREGGRGRAFAKCERRREGRRVRESRWKGLYVERRR